MSDGDEFENLDARAEGLSDSLGSAATMAASFDGELKRIRAGFAATSKDAATLERGLSRGLRRAFDGVVFDGVKLSDALETVAQSMISTTYSAAIRPVTQHFGGLLASGVEGFVSSVLPFADGAGFMQGRVTPFASGGIVSGPTHFPMRGGLGLMGEAGPEAIMPLARGPDGKLGVRGAGGAGPTVVMNISTPDAQSFQRSQGQIAAQMSRALGRGQRNR
ncbi:MAG: phage tail tape measure protein [Rhodobacteraceae bacterium]|nr:phage tail tape measure protein [Paracoccaceae bacterium]